MNDSGKLAKSSAITGVLSKPTSLASSDDAHPAGFRALERASDLAQNQDRNFADMRRCIPGDSGGEAAAASREPFNTINSEIGKLKPKPVEGETNDDVTQKFTEPTAALVERVAETVQAAVNDVRRESAPPGCV